MIKGGIGIRSSQDKDEYGIEEVWLEFYIKTE